MHNILIDTFIYCGITWWHLIAHNYPIISVVGIVCVLSRVQLSETPRFAACQASLSMEFSKQEYWSGLPFPTPGDLSHPGGLKLHLLRLLHWQEDSLPLQVCLSYSKSKVNKYFIIYVETIQNHMYMYSWVPLLFTSNYRNIN